MKLPACLICVYKKVNKNSEVLKTRCKECALKDKDVEVDIDPEIGDGGLFTGFSVTMKKEDRENIDNL